MTKKTKREEQLDLALSYGADYEAGYNWWYTYTLNGWRIWPSRRGWTIAQKQDNRYINHEFRPCLKDALLFASGEQV